MTHWAELLDQRHTRFNRLSDKVLPSFLAGEPTNEEVDNVGCLFLGNLVDTYENEVGEEEQLLLLQFGFQVLGSIEHLGAQVGPILGVDNVITEDLCGVLQVLSGILGDEPSEVELIESR